MKHVLCWLRLYNRCTTCMHALLEGSPEIGKTRPSDMRLRHAYRDYKYNTYTQLRTIVKEVPKEERPIKYCITYYLSSTSWVSTHQEYFSCWLLTWPLANIHLLALKLKMCTHINAKFVCSCSWHPVEITCSLEVLSLVAISVSLFSTKDLGLVDAGALHGTGWHLFWDVIWWWVSYCITVILCLWLIAIRIYPTASAWYIDQIHHMAFYLSCGLLLQLRFYKWPWSCPHPLLWLRSYE